MIRLKVALLTVALAAALVGMGYLAGKLSAATELNNLKGQIEYAEQEAQAKYDELLAANRIYAARIKEASERQEEIDNAAKAEIQRLSNELASRPVRVRIETNSGACGSGTRSTEAGSTDTGEANGSQAYGLLPRFNTQRLAAAIAEIETLSAAYSSCRATLELK